MTLAEFEELEGYLRKLREQGKNKDIDKNDYLIKMVQEEKRRYMVTDGELKTILEGIEKLQDHALVKLITSMPFGQVLRISRIIAHIRNSIHDEI